MMRVGTQKRTKPSSSSPNAAYRTSPTNRYTSSSPVNNSSHNTSRNTSFNRWGFLKWLCSACFSAFYLFFAIFLTCLCPNNSISNSLNNSRKHFEGACLIFTFISSWFSPFHQIPSYRQNASPLHEETHKFAQDYHLKSVAEKRMTSNSPSVNERSSPHRTSSPSYLHGTASPNYPHRTASPSYAHAAASPNYPHRTASPSYVRASSPNYPTPGRDSPDYITSKKLNEKRYDVSSSSFSKKNDYDTNYTGKMSSLRLADSRSPSFLER